MSVTVNSAFDRFVEVAIMLMAVCITALTTATFLNATFLHEHTTPAITAVVTGILTAIIITAQWFWVLARRNVLQDKKTLAEVQAALEDAQGMLQQADAIIKEMEAVMSINDYRQPVLRDARAYMRDRE